ncbi:MAG: hypothetical protein Q8K63_11000 [Acidimicrobiales bacterium]|nr:hypothetical protein [Acidimicrobiales bacterium]
MSGHVAASDCERIRPGLIGQPANTISSLAFVAAALPVWRRGGAWRWVAAALVFEGLGSVAYHGPGGRTAKFVHDIGLLGLVLAFARVAKGDPAAARPTPVSAGLGVAAGVLHVLSRTGGPLCSCHSVVQGHAVFHVLAASAVATHAGSAASPRS